MMKKKPRSVAGKTYRSDTGGTVKIAKSTTPLVPPRRSGPMTRKGRKG